MPHNPLIALIEDEDHLAQGLLFNLAAEGFTTHHESDGDAALAYLLAASPAPAAVLLDVMLPGRDGFSVLRALRAAGIYTPVLLLTARGRTEDILEGFAAGADDYLPKPFDLNILLARLTSLLRRSNWQSPPTGPGAPSTGSTWPVGGPPQLPHQPIPLNGRTINFDLLEIRHDTTTTRLTLMEADLLRYLLDNPNRTVPRKELLENVWHVHEDTDTRAIDNFIVRLRRHLETDPSKPAHLLTVRGLGYRFQPNPEAK